MHLFFILFIIVINVWVLFVPYAFIALIHFVFGRVWRYLFIIETYLSSDFKLVIFKSSKDKEMKFNCDQIIKCATYYGITDIVIEDNGNKFKFYFMINSKENLKYLR